MTSLVHVFTEQVQYWIPFPLFLLLGKTRVKDEEVAKIWTLSAQDIDDEEIVSAIKNVQQTLLSVPYLLGLVFNEQQQGRYKHPQSRGYLVAW